MDRNASTPALPFDRSAWYEEMKNVAGAVPANIRNQLLDSGASTSTQSWSNDLLAQPALVYSSVTTSSYTTITCTMATSLASTATYTVAAAVGHSNSKTTPAVNVHQLSEIDVTSFQRLKALTKKRKQQRSPQAARKKSSVPDQPSTSKTAAEAATQNRFAVLDEDEDEAVEMEEATMPSETQSEKPKARMPIIWCPNITTVTKLFQVIDKAIDPNSYTIKPRGENIGILTNCSDDYRAVVDKLLKAGVQFHHYQLKEDKPYRVCLKGLHSSTEVGEIKNELETKGHRVVNIYNPRSRIDKTPLNIFFVDLAQASNNEKIKDLRSICRQICSVEPPRKFNELAQCFRCQEFGHTQRYCHKKPRCVRCTGDHASKDCPNHRDQPPICLHCEQQHPANYKGCSVYKKKLKQQSADKKPNPKQSNRPVPSNYRTSFATPAGGMSYAQVAGGASAHAQNVTNDPVLVDILKQQQRQFEALNAELKAMRETQTQLSNMLISLVALITKLNSK